MKNKNKNETLIINYLIKSINERLIYNKVSFKHAFIVNQ